MFCARLGPGEYAGFGDAGGLRTAPDGNAAFSGGVSGAARAEKLVRRCSITTMSRAARFFRGFFQTGRDAEVPETRACRFSLEGDFGQLREGRGEEGRGVGK